MLSPDATAIQITNEIESIFDRHASINPEPLLAEFDRIAAQVGDRTALKCLLMAHAVAAVRLKSGEPRPA